jgi:hypothetical protein
MNTIANPLDFSPFKPTIAQRRIAGLSYALAIGLTLGALSAAQGQISTINSVNVHPRVFNDVPGATLTVVTNYPAVVSFNEHGVSAPTGFANRDVWQFSNNRGASAYGFQHDDYFQASFDLTLTGNPISPRKEAGFMISTGTDGDIQFIVNTDGHEVVQFGGISFYSFSGNNIVSYNSGDKIHLGVTYFLDDNNKNALQFFANGNASPIFEFGSSVGGGASGIDDGSTVGGYFQIVQDSSNTNNSGAAVFQNLNIVTRPHLSIVPSGNKIVLYWPAGATNFVLQSTTNLTTTNWTAVTNGTPIIGVTVSNTVPPTYFRLQQTQ